MTISSAVSVHPTVCPFQWNNSVPTGQSLMKFGMCVFFQKNIEKIQVSLKSDKNNMYFTWIPMCMFYCISLSSSKTEKVSDKSCRENQNTRLCSKLFFKSCAIYETVRKNTAEPGRPQMTIRRMRTACWTPRATNRHSEYVILIAFPLQQWLHKRAPVLSYTYISCLL